MYKKTGGEILSNLSQIREVHLEKLVTAEPKKPISQINQIAYQKRSIGNVSLEDLYHP